MVNRFDYLKSRLSAKAREEADRKTQDMLNPPHPGSILREDVLPALSLNLSQAAEALGISSERLSRILSEEERITPELALRIECWLGVENGGRAAVWSEMQIRYDQSARNGLDGTDR